MVRAPCCEKMGLKKGPWTSEEDQILINYIQQYGHGNWRALPKLAGLLRCGKSCRLRWTNYLRPDIKRGNFSPEEEETIIKLHEMLGNRWSAIASKLPGRTDNEIKNVWHTHLKKRLIRHDYHNTQETKRHRSTNITSKQTQEPNKEEETSMINNNNFSSININQTKSENIEYYNRPVSPPQCSSEISSVTTGTTNDSSNINNDEKVENFSEMDENFWSEVLSAENSEVVNDFSSLSNVDRELQFLFSPMAAMEPVHASNSYDSGMDFWYNIFTRAGETPESILLPHF